jgi:hypothetical protein
MAKTHQVAKVAVGLYTYSVVRDYTKAGAYRVFRAEFTVDGWRHKVKIHDCASLADALLFISVLV